jgi:hypothetical protein
MSLDRVGTTKTCTEGCVRQVVGNRSLCAQGELSHTRGATVIEICVGIY